MGKHVIMMDLKGAAYVDLFFIVFDEFEADHFEN